MGHVSDFNGMNTCDETELSQSTSDLISADNILDSLQENFMPVYNSFPDDIYRHPNLYASGNLTSFINNDDERNGYFDEPLELDLFFDSNNFNFDFGASEPIAENEVSVLQNDSVNDEGSVSERNGDTKTENEQERSELQACSSQTASQSDINSQENGCYVDNSETPGPSVPKTYTAETVFKNSEYSPMKAEDVPKIIIKLKPESKCTEDFYTAEASAPMTIADNVKLGRRRNGNFKSDVSRKSTTKDVNKRHKTHKRKSRHKKRQRVFEAKNETLKTNQNFNTKLPNYNIHESNHLILNQNATVNTILEESKECDDGSSEFKNESNCQLFNNTIICFKKSSPSINRELYSYNNDHVSNSSNNSVNNQTGDKTESELSAETGDCFQFDFADADSMSSPSSVDMKQETRAEDFLDHIDIALEGENIPDFNKSLLGENESTKIVDSSDENSLFCGVEKEESCSTVQTETIVANNECVKSGSVSDLIEELNAHNQEVFKEIEVSTPDLELELTDAKNSTIVSVEASHQPENSANENVTVQNKTVTDHGENDMNSQNHLSNSKISSQTASTFYPTNISHSRTARPRNISSSGSSVTSKSSTSHRSYRKRRRSSSSSSNSDREKFYNRPVKYDPVTQTYCDEFGREIRPNALKYYLDSKSRPRDTHSNNGSSSSSRSKSPRYRSYHQKHHKSRSGSRSRRRRRYPSSRSRSRSRSRSHGRKYKDDSDRRYRSPSPMHRSKRHFMEVEESMIAYEERRVMYVGDIPPDYTVEQLKDRFSRFGPIQTASIKSKVTADGSLYIFGFVTFKNRLDVCQAIERGNENPSWPRFDLNFGGRRRFCNGNYTDLDGKVAEAESGWYGHQNSYRQQPKRQDDDFAELLRQEQRRIELSKK